MAKIEKWNGSPKGIVKTATVREANCPSINDPSVNAHSSNVTGFLSFLSFLQTSQWLILEKNGVEQISTFKFCIRTFAFDSPITYENWILIYENNSFSVIVELIRTRLEISWFREREKKSWGCLDWLMKKRLQILTR